MLKTIKNFSLTLFYLFLAIGFQSTLYGAAAVTETLGEVACSKDWYKNFHIRSSEVGSRDQVHRIIEDLKRKADKVAVFFHHPTKDGIWAETLDSAGFTPYAVPPGEKEIVWVYRNSREIPEYSPTQQSADVFIYCRSTKRVLLGRDKIRKYWSIPGGGVNQKEHPHMGGAREAKEEVGVKLDPEKLILLSLDSTIRDERFSGVAPLTFLGHTFAAIVNETDAKTAKADGEENDDIKWVTLDEIRTCEEFDGIPIFKPLKEWLTRMDNVAVQPALKGRNMPGKSPDDSVTIFVTLKELSIQ